MVKAYIRKRILDGTYVPDCPIPPEREMALLLGVNRMTVRRAVEDLMFDGYLIRKKGSGTYLTGEKIRKDRLIAAEKEEGEQSMRLIGCTYSREGSYGLRMLELSEGGEEGYWRLRRIRYVKQIPFAYEDIYLRESFFGRVDETYYSMGLHAIVREKGGEAHPLRQQNVEALLCLKSTAQFLNVKPGSPILQIKTRFYHPERDVLMLYCRSYHPGDSYVFQTHRVTIH